MDEDDDDDDADDDDSEKEEEEEDEDKVAEPGSKEIAHFFPQGRDYVFQDRLLITALKIKIWWHKAEIVESSNTNFELLLNLLSSAELCLFFFRSKGLQTRSLLGFRSAAFPFHNSRHRW